MEYVTKSLMNSEKWCSFFVAEMKVDRSLGKVPASPSDTTKNDATNCLMALRLSGLQMQKTLLVEQGFEFGR